MQVRIANWQYYNECLMNLKHDVLRSLQYILDYSDDVEEMDMTTVSLFLMLSQDPWIKWTLFL